MDINVLSLPSKGWKSELPEQFEMRLFEGRQIRQIAKAIETKDMRPILLEALPECLSVPIDALTIQDAHALILQQRLAMKAVSPLLVRWNCKKPMFEYSDGVKQDLQEDRPAINAFPCDARNISELDESSLLIYSLSAESEEFDLARMRDYEQASESMFNWNVAHLGPNFNQNMARLEQERDLSLWLRLSDWVTDSRHGISTEISLPCHSCGRHSIRDWQMTPSIFVG
ncbi:hypothetical protein fHeYen902_020c [Yersinia phage fHe-Yen9-02]|nr:hypothetical protein fHeYen902_020c [Yersinia phage fHe-Yen9-02]